MIVDVRPSLIKRNLENMRLTTGKPLIFMCKANAYGHGALHVVSALKAAAYGVATEEEGTALRAVTSEPILVTTPKISALPILSYTQEIPLIGELHYARAFIEEGTPKTCHIKVNSGMNRLGFSTPSECARVADALLSSGMYIAGICTHYKEDSDANVQAQNRRFDECVLAIQRVLARYGVPPAMTHVTACGYKYAAKYDALRVGLAAYGYGEEIFRLQKAMYVTSEILSVKKISAGDTLGYGSGFTAKKETGAYTVLGGYADGIARNEVGRVVYAEGKVCRIASVCMDSFEMVSDSLDLKVGSRVIILSDKNDAKYIASVRGTIPYEVLLGYDSPRAERKYDEREDVTEEDM